VTERSDLGRVDAIKADAIGDPGNRTFRLRAMSSEGSATLWLEKEQLQALGMAIDEILAQLRASRVGQSEAMAPSAESGDFPARSSVDFRIGRLGLGYDESRDALSLLAHDQESDPDGPPTVQMLAGRGQMRRLSTEITAVVSAGRPRCPLCNTPITPGSHHSCPRANGKAPHPVSA